jgi:hypothetical protein
LLKLSFAILSDHLFYGYLQVILTSDHGHIVEVSSQYKSSNNGERWRMEDQHLNDGELLVTGSRILIPDSQTLIAPWTEKIR